MPDPWVAVEATVRRSDKLAALPSDTARWGWLVMLGEAKLLRRQGAFSKGQWSELMGRFAKYRPDYIAAGLLHEAPAFCALDRRDGCLKGRGPFPRGTLVVHDWPRHQREHAARQADYRERQSGDVESDGESDVLSDAQSDAESDIPSRARLKTETETVDRDNGKAPQAIAVAKPRASGPTNEPRLTQRELDSWSDFTNPKWRAFKEAWMARGLHYAPYGSPDDDDTSQRGLLWQVVDARPNDVARWVSEAPLPNPREVITYVLEQWHSVRDEAGVDDDEWEEQKREERRQASGGMARLGEIMGSVAPSKDTAA